MKKRKLKKSSNLPVYPSYAEMKLHFKNDLETRLLSMSLEDRSYFLRYLPTHLAQGDLLEPLLDLLTNCSFMQSKINDYGSLMLISDYERVPGNKELQIVREAGQLWPQLYGRLFDEKEPLIHTMLSDWPEGLWLHTRSGRLAAPCSPLLMTLDVDEQDDPIADLAVTQDGCRVVSGSESDRLRVWDLNGGQCLHHLEEHSSDILQLLVSSDGTRLFSSSDDRTIRVWDIKTGKLLQTLEGHQDFIEQISLTRNDCWPVSACSDSDIRIWDWAPGTLEVSFFGDSGMDTVACTQDCSTLVVGDSAGKLHFFQLEGKPPAAFFKTGIKCSG